MPTNAVYQPTTVSFENSGGSLLAQTTAGSRLKTAFRTSFRKNCLLVASLLFIATGIVLTASAFADYEDAIENSDVVTDIPVHEEELDIGFIILGVFFILFGFFLLGLYIKVADCWRRNCVVCPCSLTGRKKQGLARQLQGQSGGQIMALNPSTDPLVGHTQYAPVSEVPRIEDEEERKKLMDKDCVSTAEESQLLGPDPRIVLRPATQVDDA